MTDSQWLELLMSRTNIHGPNDVRVIEVRLYLFNLIMSQYLGKLPYLVTKHCTDAYTHFNVSILMKNAGKNSSCYIQPESYSIQTAALNEMQISVCKAQERMPNEAGVVNFFFSGVESERRRA